MPLGLYLSVPFCRAKCSFCNFASGVFSRDLFESYVCHLERELGQAEKIAARAGGSFERQLDSVYLGGGTPTVLAPEQLERIFAAIKHNFELLPGSEITLECAPGTLQPELLEALAVCGANRVSLGVQSFIEQEARSVGRLHTRHVVLDEIARLRQAGITEISLDLIAGLPHQTELSWRATLAEAVASGAPHVSVYMLEVDEDSRLGRELIAGGARYHAHHVPDEDLTADLYLLACEELNSAGLMQYEISNFARENGDPSSGCFPAHASRHNLKYWLRQPYLGFGVDAHSMLPVQPGSAEVGAGARHSAVRFATPDSLELLLSGAPSEMTAVNEAAALEETWFLGLRLNRGVELSRVEEAFGPESLEPCRSVIAELEGAGLLALTGGFVRLTSRGRLLANEVFSRFLLAPGQVPCTQAAAR